MPVDFEGGASWPEQLSTAGFDPGRPADIVSTGVTMYLTKDATAADDQHALVPEQPHGDLAAGVGVGSHASFDIAVEFVRLLALDLEPGRPYHVGHVPAL